MKLISVVTPCYNEEENVEELCRRVKQVFAGLEGYDYEHIFIDNASTDRTVEILKRLAEEKQKEELWRLVNKAIEMTQGAREGAEYVLSQKLASPSSKKSPR